MNKFDEFMGLKEFTMFITDCDKKKRFATIVAKNETQALRDARKNYGYVVHKCLPTDLYEWLDGHTNMTKDDILIGKKAYKALGYVDSVFDLAFKNVKKAYWKERGVTL